MTTDGILVSQIRKEFGDLAFNADESINREHLAENVFKKADRLSKLNSLVHPRVAEDYKQWLALHAYEPFVIKEAAIMIETGGHRLLNHIILVSAPESLRIERVLQRDPHRSKQDILAIIRNQMREEEKLQYADDVILNDETEMIIPQVLKLHEKLSARA
jgi:dephospho-CoA kinase